MGSEMCIRDSVYTVRVKKKAGLHRTVQIGTALVLLLAILAFEIDMRFVTDWRELAKASPFYESGAVDCTMWIHLMFAVPTPFVWAGVIIWSWRKFKTGYQQGSFNRTHRILGWLATILMMMTALTGWVFYYMAFVA